MEAVLLNLKDRIITEKMNLMSLLADLNNQGMAKIDITRSNEYDLSAASTMQGIQRVSISTVKTKLQGLITAEQKIEQGTYGLCSQCGGLIEAARLEKIIPIFHCKRCREKNDNNQKRISQVKFYVVKR